MISSTLRRALFCSCIGMAVFFGCAAVPPYEHRGVLESGDNQTGNVFSVDVWMFYGEEGTRVVISDAVQEGEAPPGIYLYPPDSTECEAFDEGPCECYRVLDHELESTGEYTLLLHRSGMQHEGQYKVSLAKLPPEGSYCIVPLDQDGKIIRSDCVLPEECVEGLEFSAGLATPYIVTPYMVAPAAVMIHSALGAIADLLDFSGRDRISDLVEQVHERQMELAGTRGK